MRPNTVTPIMPENTVVPSVWRSSAPAPIAQTSGDDAEDEGERRHQDRAQPQPRRLDRRVPAVAALLLELLRELDDQDGVLGGEADQHDEADLGEDVVVLPAQDHAGDRGDEAHRHDQDHGERQRQALELRGEHQEHEHHGEREGEDRGVAGPDLLERERRPLVAKPSGSVSAASFCMISIAWPCE